MEKLAIRNKRISQSKPDLRYTIERAYECAYMYIYIYIYMRMHLYPREFAFVYTQKCKRIFLCAYACVCVGAFACVRLRACLRAALLKRKTRLRAKYFNTHEGGFTLPT